MHHMLGGIQRLMPELLLMLAPNVNSFKRLVPGIFAPVVGVLGRSTPSPAAHPGTPDKDTRRVPQRRAPSCQPLSRDAASSRGPDTASSIRSKPGPPLQRDAYAAEVPEELAFPAAFRDGIDRFRSSAVARELFGDTFVDHYADTREWQEREFRALVTDRELERFFELS